MDGWTDGRTTRWMDGRMDGLMDGWMDSGNLFDHELYPIRSQLVTPVVILLKWERVRKVNRWVGAMGAAGAMGVTGGTARHVAWMDGWINRSQDCQLALRCITVRSSGNHVPPDTSRSRKSFVVVPIWHGD